MEQEKTVKALGSHLHVRPYLSIDGYSFVIIYRSIYFDNILNSPKFIGLLQYIGVGNHFIDKSYDGSEQNKPENNAHTRRKHKNNPHPTL